METAGIKERLIHGQLTERILACAIEVPELKSIDALLSIHSAQIRTYLKFLNLRVGLLMNFNVTNLMTGIRRYVC